MNTCKAFELPDRKEQSDHLRDLEFLEDFGDYCCGHYLHTWDDGHRFLCRCRCCNALILVQRSEFHGMEEDVYYTDYFSVTSRQEAIWLNERFDGFRIEQEAHLKHIYRGG